MNLLFKVINQAPETEATLADTDFRAHFSAVNKNLSWYALKTSIRKVTKEYIVPHVGEVFYKDFARRFTEAQMVGDPQQGFVIGDPATGIILGIGEMSVEDFELLEHLRDAIAEYTIWYLVGERIIKISDAGLQVPQSTEGHSSKASAWEVKHYSWQRMRRGDTYLDMALKYLHEQQDLFPEFDPADIERYRCFIQTMGEFHAIVPIAGSHRTFQKILPFIDATEEETLHILGDALTAQLLSTYQDKALSTQQQQLLKRLQQTIAWKAAQEALPTLSVFVENEGIRTMTSSDGMNSKQVMLQERIDRLMIDYEAKYHTAKEKLITFLFKNTTDFPDWQSSDLYIEMTNDEGIGVPYSFGDGGVFLT